MDNGSSSPDTDLAAVRSQALVEYWHHQCMETSNPLYACRAIRECWLSKIPLPDWCLEYLGRVTLNLCDLMDGVDFRKLTTPTDQESEEEFRKRLAERYMAARDKPEITPNRALKYLGQAMLFSGRGQNQFVNYRFAEQDIQDTGTHLADTLFDRPKTPLKRRRRRFKRNGHEPDPMAHATPDSSAVLEDTRQSLRRIAKGKRLSRLPDPSR